MMTCPRLALFTAAFAFLATAALAAPPGCLNYEPSKVKLGGVVNRRTYYGPPNYGEDPKTDSRETFWFLTLDRAICVNAGNDDTPEMEGERNIRRLQLVFSGDYPRGRWVGRRAVVSGGLYHRFDAHHHTRVLIDVKDISHAP